MKKRIYGFLKKYIDPIVPLWAILPIINCFVVNCLVYYTTLFVCGSLKHYDLTLPIDRAWPFVPEWIYVYFIYCYIFWAIGYLMVAAYHPDDKKRVYRFVTADMLSRIICLVFFIAIPTTNVRPEITGDTISERLTLFLYSIDKPVNLFPSIHCLVSWMCFIGIRDSKTVPKFVKLWSFISAIAIILSTQFLKQHYIVDVLGGVALAEFCYFICGRTRASEYVERFYEKIYSLSQRKK